MFYPGAENAGWTKFKRKAESGNSNAFDSFSRYMQEPSFRKKPFAIFYYIITHNIRLTRELNNIVLEQGNENEENNPAGVTESQQKLVEDCRMWFDKNILLL